MDAIKVRRASAAGVVVIAIAIVLFMMFPKLDPFKLPAASAGTPPTGCASSVHYAAYDAPAGSNQFGPTATSFTQTTAIKRLGVKLCSDPLFAATMVSFEQQGSNLSAATATATAKAYVANRSEWSAGVKTFYNEVGSYSVDFKDVTYESMRMVPGSSRAVMPALGKVARPVQLGYVLTLHLKNGQTRYLRIVCDLQPSAPNLPNMPVKVTPPVTPHTPTTHYGCPAGEHFSPLPGYTHVCIAPKDPSKDVLRNPKVPPYVKGHGTTPVGTSPGPAHKPVHTPTGCDGACPGTLPSATPSDAPTSTPAPPAPIASDPPVPTPITPPPPPAS